MSQELSTKTYCIKMSDGSFIYIDDKQKSAINTLFNSGNDSAVIDIDDENIRIKYIMGIYKVSTIEAELRRKNGEFQCGGCKQWLPKGSKCGNCFGY